MLTLDRELRKKQVAQPEMKEQVGNKETNLPFHTRAAFLTPVQVPKAQPTEGCILSETKRKR